MLHNSILPNARTHWSHFFRFLNYIIIDGMDSNNSSTLYIYILIYYSYIIHLFRGTHIPWTIWNSYGFNFKKVRKNTFGIL